MKKRSEVSQLVEAGLTDKEAAKVLGIHRNDFCKRRLKLKLPRNKK
jgi:hypothetical protein